MSKQTRSLLIKLAGSALILFVLFSLIDIDPKEFTAILQELNISYYLISLFGVVIVLAIKSLRWQQIIKNEGFYYSPQKAFGAYMASFTIGVITPGRIGEIARLYYLRQDCEIDFLTSFRTIIIDRIFDLGVLVMLAIAGLFYYTGLLENNIYLAVIVGIAIFFIGLVLSTLVIQFLKKSTKLNKNQFLNFIDLSLKQSIDLKSVKLWGITLLAYLAFYGALALIFLAVGIQLKIVDIALIFSVVSLATLLPISWAGFGTREVSLVYLLSFYQVPAETAITFSLLQFGAFFLFGGIIGLVFWLLMPISLEKIKTDSQSLKQMISRKKKSDTPLENKS
ncbi:MAG: lysylphosphatidylglycerol synthase transmembrane domain-containing protein [Bacteroidales bacterium]|nr:lysylphosphatidylglycerol synthase transmembrane domain-containing protein [Bacteroidales bacterium]HOI31927.1 lysylphosphatidylglycerol synthase transmembrane domain-containing protein [Bacteroidales bacterium]